jgi:hypothetical protein
VAGQNVGSQPETEEHGLPGVGDPEHERVADRLDLRTPEARELGFDGVADVRHELGGLLVAVRLGQSGEAGDVGLRSVLGWLDGNGDSRSRRWFTTVTGRRQGPKGAYLTNNLADGAC